MLSDFGHRDFHRCSRILSLLAYGLLMVGIAGCKSEYPAGDTSLSTADLFRLHCSSCHGDGTGNGHVAATLKAPPRNLKHHQWQASVTDAHIKKVIGEGGAAVKLNEAMPGFADKLTSQQIHQLMLYIRLMGK